jgi:hypothetical protein
VGPSGGRFLPQGPLWRKRVGGPGKYQNRVKLTPMDRDPVMGQFQASLPVPDPVRSGQIRSPLLAIGLPGGGSGAIARWTIQTCYSPMRSGSVYRLLPVP